MIVAEIYTQHDGKIVAFVLKGHSDISTGGHGYNVHCAKVSMLSQAAFIAVTDYLKCDLKENYEHGGLGLELKTAPDDATEAVLRTMLIGLEAVKKIAPDVIDIKLIERDASTEAALQRKIADMKPTPPKALPKVNVNEVRIRAEIFLNAEGNVHGFSIRERKGKTVNEFEIYRAGVWSMVKAAFSCVKDYLKRDLQFKSASRRLEMHLKSAPDVETEAVFQTMLIGLREVEKLAPQIVQVNEKIPHGGETE